MTYHSSVPLFWRLKKNKYNLVGSKCTTCTEVFFPPRAMCSTCRRKGKIEEIKLSGKGVIESFTVIKTPPEGFEKFGPYTVGIIMMDEGVRISGQIIGTSEHVTVGKKVQTTFRKMSEDGASGLIHYGMKWEMVE